MKFVHSGILYGADSKAFQQLSTLSHCKDLKPQLVIDIPKRYDINMYLRLYSQISSIIDQCYNWSIFVASSKPSITTYLQSLRESIVLRSPNCPHLFSSGIQFIQSCLQQYEDKMTDHIEKVVSVRPEGVKDLQKLLQIAQELKSALVELLHTLPADICIDVMLIL